MGFGIKVYGIALAISSLASSGCVTVQSDKNNGTNVALGQTAYVDGPRIKVVKVLEDSRCPINARCMRAGTAKVQILWLRPLGDQTLELTLGEPKQMADGTMTFTAIAPGKIAGGPEIKPTDYRFSFTFAGGL